MIENCVEKSSRQMLADVPGISLLSWLERSKISIEEALETAIDLGLNKIYIEEAVKSVNIAYRDYLRRNDLC